EDGRLECTKVISGLGPINTAAGSNFRTGSFELGDWPQPFATAPDVRMHVTKATGFGQAWATSFSAYPTDLNAGNAVLLRSLASTDTDFILTVHATGRWF